MRLTLDANIQDHTEEVLDEVGETWQPKGATALVMDPRDGAILALANWPRVNANKLHEAPEYAMTNRATGATYEPGSTFKAFTVAGALEDGKVTPSTQFSLPPILQVADREITDSHPRGWESRDVAGILAQSSNVGAALIGRRLGARRFDQWVRRFGFGTPTGVDLPGEEGGIVLTYDEYTGPTAANMAMGQGLAVTPMQMGAAYAAIANGGILRPPHIVGSVGGVERPVPEGKRILSEETAASVRKMLEGVLGPGGTATGAAIEGYELGGKTGTAEKPDENGGYSKTKFVASFVGFAPAKHPRLLVAVMVDEPKGDIYGGTVAGPGVQEDHVVRADEPADRARVARTRRQSSAISASPIASSVIESASATHGWVTIRTTTTPTRKSSVRLAVAVVTGSGERLTTVRRPALTAWLASAVVLEPTAASASSRPVASPFSSTPSAAAIVGRIAVWIVSQTWST